MIYSSGTKRRIIPKITGIILLLFLKIGFPVTAQNYFFDNYSVEEGLGQSKVYAILQSSIHQIWIGTKSGVSRFDGISFRNYTSEDGLAENSVRAIYEDSHGNIWFGHNMGGITRFDGRKFESIPAGRIFTKDVTSISESANGDLWFTSAGSGAVLVVNPNAKLENLKYIKYNGSKLSDLVFSSYKLKNGSLLFITDVGVKKFNEVTKSFENYSPRLMPKYFQITSMYEDCKGNIWFGTHHGGVYEYFPQTDTIKIFDIRDGLSSNWITCFCEDRNKNMWVGTWGEGITVFSNDGLKVFSTSNGLHDNNIRSIIEDAEGNILIGTTENGFSIFRGDYMVNYFQEKTSTKQQVWAILEDNSKNIWFGTNSGITVFNPVSPPEKRYTNFTPANCTVSDQIRYLKKDLNGDIWIGTDINGVYRYDSKKRVFLPAFTVNALFMTPQDQGVTALEIDKDNVLWIGTNDGVYTYNITTEVSKRYSTADGLAGNIVNALYCMADNSMVIGLKGKGITIIKGDVKKSYTFENSESPQCFTEDRDHNLWIGTESHGILGFKNEKVFKRYSTREGLLSNLINFLNTDTAGNIFCGTNRGLNRIDIASDKIFIYTKRNGFIGIEAKKDATFTDSQGNVWFGTMNGAIRYSPWLDNKPSMQPLTHIYSFRVNQADHEILPDMILQNSENSISIDYFSICLTNPDAVQYQVMLQGIDNDWLPQSTQTSISYPALPPGNYVFKVRAKNAAGIWNTIPASLSFQILPPFYLRWYSIVGMIVIVIIFLTLYIKLRERKLIYEKTVLEEKIGVRTQEMMNMNEELATKNKDVVSSIQYARHIQLSVLPTTIPFDNTFVLFKPKDIVSGDFFWFMEDQTYEWMAAVDCTGHGVPGAFMSLISYNSLNKIVREMNIKVPSDILNALDDEISKTFKQYTKEESISDGMDIALIRYNKNTHVLDYAGAFNPLWIIRKRELLETRADRFAIGRTPHVDKKFSNDITQLQPDDVVYLFTDGYADQFGGPENKKYKTAKFKEYIINIQQYSMQMQKEMLEKNIEKWRGNQMQVDDILVIGRKFRF